MEEFLSKWYGILLFVAFDFIALIAVISITYRWLFKRILDMLTSGTCLIITFPLLLIGALTARAAVKRGEADSVVVGEEFVGKKGKKITLHRFTVGRLCLLPRLADVFCGRLSFIGVQPFTAGDCAFLDDDEEHRLFVRAGLINPLVRGGNAEIDYDDMIASDMRYVKNFSFFGDCKIFFAWLIGKIRGEGDEYLGKTRGVSYAKSLLDEARITEEDYRAACQPQE